MISYKNELYHHGIKGQKWGVRRYRNEDGTLTAAGKKRYHKDIYGSIKKFNKQRDSTKQFSTLQKDLKPKIKETLTYSQIKALHNMHNEVVKAEQLYLDADIATDSNVLWNIYRANPKKYVELGIKVASRDGFTEEDIRAARKDLHSDEAVIFGMNGALEEAFSKNPEYRNATEQYERATKKYESKLKAFTESYVEALGDKTYSKLDTSNKQVVDYLLSTAFESIGYDPIHKK